MKLLLIDAYALIYRSYYAFLKNPRINSKGMNTSAVFGFVNTLEDVLKRIEPTHVAVGFDPSGPTFRHELFEQYKAQRQETPEDIRLSTPVIRSIIDAYRIPILEVSGFEADDTIGTVAKQAEKEGFEVYMMTPDKDYGQLVSEHIFQYRPKFGGDYEKMGVSEVLAKFAIQNISQVIDLLGLMGDSADNIPGCPNVGEKTAQKLLAEYGSIDNLLANTALLKGAVKKNVEENAEQIRFSRMLATIVTDVPIKFDAAACIRQQPDNQRLAEIYTEMEFRSFLNRMQPQVQIRQDYQAAGASKKSGTQLSLFDDFTDDFTNDSTNDFTNDFTNKATTKNIENTPHTYHLVNDDIAIKKLAAMLENVGSFTFDTETDSAEPVTAGLVGMSFAVSEFEAWYVPVPADRDEATKTVNIFKKALEDPNIEKTGQNLKFDILVLRKYGVKVAGRLFDTMLAHYLLSPELRHGMDYLSETYLNYMPIPIEQLIGAKGKNQLTMRNIPVEKVAEYAAEDADVTLRLRNLFEPKLKKSSMESLFYDIETPLIPVLADMENTGIKIDTEALKAYSVTLTEKQHELEHDIYSLAGVEFNINSPKQVSDVLFERLKLADGKLKKTSTGGYSTSEDVLEKLRNKHPLIGKLLDYRGVKKLLGTYIDALPKMLNLETGKIHTSYNQAVTSTGRLSSTNPNLQNIPVRDEMGREIRKAFIADNEDCVFFSADYSQIELRVMAHISGDPNMIAAFNQGADIHASTAAKIYGVADTEVTSEMRRKAKTANFGIIYGISAFGLAERLNISRTEAKELIEGYFKTYPRIHEYMTESIVKAREKGFVETIFNRHRALPDIYSQNATVRGYAERFAINAPIQGSAADIIKVAMINIYKRFEAANLNSKMLLQVHDELNFNVLKSEFEQVKRIVLDEMEGAISLKVPLIADCGEGRNWLEAH
ncbi:MAG: DNA polymerase I [Tannerella sp.]|jgi:DNA polymerase-1|nr:DNA polymerase I [Tannerella sp.]